MGKIETFQNLDHKRVCLTAYSAAMAKAIAPHVDLLLVGDSLGMVLYGLDSTRGVTLDMMIAHGAAVRRGAPDALLIIDMPYGSYEESPDLAVQNAQRVMDETGADGVKLEGGIAMSTQIQAITKAGIPVMGHIGLLPQSAPDEGGYKIKGKNDDQTTQLIKDARAVQEAGAFSFVLEGTIEETARHIVAAISIPVIGIGASAACDGQILVSEDMLGLNPNTPAKFVKEYAQLKGQIADAAAEYAADVKNQTFPGEEHVYRNRK